MVGNWEVNFRFARDPQAGIARHLRRKVKPQMWQFGLLSKIAENHQPSVG